tara:strand:+ start:56757 stop:57971 length:1215 start_codon:yes stop_codon:yes gene_type:complete
MDSIKVNPTKENKWLFVQLGVSRLLALDKVSGEEQLLNIFFIKRTTKYLIAFIKLIFFLISHALTFNRINLNQIDHIFFSSKEGHDIKNYLRHIDPKPYIKLEAFSMRSFYKLSQIPSLKNILKLYLEAIYSSEQFLLSPKGNNSVKNSIYKESLSVIANYVYISLIMENLIKVKPKLKFYHCGAVLLSVAMNRAGIKSNYLTHGFIGTISKAGFPEYEEIFVYSSDEKSHIYKITKHNNIFVYPINPIESRKNKVLIFLRKFDEHMEKQTIFELIEFFQGKDFRVALKPHPSYKGNLIKEITADYNVLIAEKDKDAETIILEEKPLFAAGWYSTALCEALKAGSIPICLGNEIDYSISKHQLSKIIYPLSKRSLAWNEERKTISRILGEEYSVNDLIQKLKLR